MEPQKPYTLLIVDDDRDDQFMLKKILATILPSATIAQAYNGDECLRYLEAHAHALPDLITMDLNMPLVNGFEATEQIKANSAVKHIPVVVLTTSDRGIDKTTAMGSGADDYFVKPVIYEELQQTLKDVAEKWLK